jgi:hypothetical protein
MIIGGRFPFVGDGIVDFRIVMPGVTPIEFDTVLR